MMFQQLAGWWKAREATLKAAFLLLLVGPILIQCSENSPAQATPAASVATAQNEPSPPSERPSAEPAALSADFEICNEASGGVTVEMMHCSATEIAAQDARLNTVYGQLMDKLEETDESRVILRDEQRLWIKIRDVGCRYKESRMGGTLGAVIYNTCIATETASRANELRRRLSVETE